MSKHKCIFWVFGDDCPYCEVERLSAENGELRHALASAPTPDWNEVEGNRWRTVKGSVYADWWDQTRPYTVSTRLPENQAESPE